MLFQKVWFKIENVTQKIKGGFMPRGGKRENSGRNKLLETEKSIRVSYYLRPNEKAKMDLLFLELKEKRKYTPVKKLKDRFVCDKCGRNTISLTQYNEHAGLWLCEKCNTHFFTT